MQVGGFRFLEIADHGAVSALVHIVGIVQRLVRILHEMNDIAKSSGTFFAGSGLIFQNLPLLLNRSGDAPGTVFPTVRWAPLVEIFPGSRNFGNRHGNVHEVPCGGLFTVPGVVRPGGQVGHDVSRAVLTKPVEGRVDRVFFQQFIHSGRGLGFQLLARHEGNHLVALATPSERAGSTKGYSKAEEENAHETMVAGV